MDKAHSPRIESRLEHLNKHLALPDGYRIECDRIKGYPDTVKILSPAREPVIWKEIYGDEYETLAYLEENSTFVFASWLHAVNEAVDEGRRWVRSGKTWAIRITPKYYFVSDNRTPRPARRMLRPEGTWDAIKLISHCMGLPHRYDD